MDLVTKRLPMAVALSSIILAASACAAGQASPSPAPLTASPPPAAPSPSPSGPGASLASPATSIPVTLQEWAVVPAAPSVTAGDVTFTVTNAGPEDEHEFVIVRTDLDADALPTEATGAVDEGGEGMEVIDEIEDIPVGETQELTATLEAGKYVLLCNIYSEDEQESHYALGMATDFTVTE